MNGMYRAVLIGLVLACLVACDLKKAAPVGMQPQNPSPMVDHIRAHQRIDPGTFKGMRFQIPDILDTPFEVFVPDRESETGFKNIWFHFHGADYIIQSGIEKANEPVIGIGLHLGAGSSVYERAFSDRHVFLFALEALFEKCQIYGVALHPDRQVFISSFSAGYGAIRSILSYHSEEIYGVLLLDGLHTDYIPQGRPLDEGGHIHEEKLLVFIEFARQAVADRKRMIITHSEIFPGTYASTTETADAIIRELGLKRDPVLEWGPVGMQMIARTRQNGLTILGFAGNSAPDHLDHLHGFPFFLNEFFIY